MYLCQNTLSRFENLIQINRLPGGISVTGPSKAVSIFGPSGRDNLSFSLGTQNVAAGPETNAGDSCGNSVGIAIFQWAGPGPARSVKHAVSNQEYIQ